LSFLAKKFRQIAAAFLDGTRQWDSQHALDVIFRMAVNLQIYAGKLIPKGARYRRKRV
jgi:hypothetical protein